MSAAGAAPRRDWRATVVLAAGLALAAATPAGTAAWQGADDDGVVTTRHSITLNGRTLAYTARAGTLPIRHNETGEPQGHVFFVAYSVEPAAGAPPRPLTFLWNGGPGANSTLVHFDGFGPRRVRTLDHADPGSTIMQDNQETWLDFTDLVFVDPVGTGFSRPAHPDHTSQFYGTLGDIASIAEFVRLYLTRHDAWDAPLFLGGESFGTWRAAGVAETLERTGIRVAGVILISGGIPVGDVSPDAVRGALFVPARTHAAHYHRRLDPDLQADLDATLRRVEAWARDVYAPALVDRAALGAVQRAAIADSLARFTGLDRAAIDERNLVVGRQFFAEQLLRDEGRVLARFDTRQAAPPGAAAGSGSTRARLILDYLRGDLGYRVDDAYQGLETGYTPATTQARPVGSRWNYDQNTTAEAPADTALRRLVWEGPPRGSEPWLYRAMALNPRLGAFVAIGVYDSLNSCPFSEDVIGRLEPGFAARIELGCYTGGHMMYEDEDTREPLKRDVAAFIAASIARAAT